MKYFVESRIGIICTFIIHMSTYPKPVHPKEMIMDSMTNEDCITEIPIKDEDIPDIVPDANFMEHLKQVLIEIPGIQHPLRQPENIRNEKRKLLEQMNRFYPKPDYKKTQKAILSFERFVHAYEDIKKKLKTAVDDLRNILENASLPPDDSDEAYTLRTALLDSKSLCDAQKMLKKYKQFKQKIQGKLN